MFKDIITSKKYWLSVSFIGIGFIIVFSVIEHMMQNGGFAIGTFLQDKVESDKWMRYLVSRLVGGLMYGMIMAYYFEVRKRKSN